MNVQFSETQEMLRTSAREFLAENCPPSLVRDMCQNETGYARDLWNAMAALGWPGLCLPEEHGGSGLTFLDFCLLQEELGRACAPAPLTATAAAGLAIADAGSEAQRAELLPRIASGDALVTVCPAWPRDSRGAEEPPVARPSDDGFSISGGLDFVPWADAAEAVLCPAIIGPTCEETRLVVLRMNAPGLSITPLHNAAGPDRLWQLRLDSVRVETETVLEHSGVDTLGRMVTLLDAARCCDLVGTLSHVLEATIAYANERTQFGRTIGSFQTIQHYCADMHIMLEGLRMSAYVAAWSLSEGNDGARSTAIACAYAHRVVPPILNLAHQIHGAMGVTYEHDLHLYTTRATPPAHDLLPMAAYLEVVHTS